MTERLDASKRFIAYFLSQKDKLGSLSVSEGRNILQIASYMADNALEEEWKQKGLDLLFFSCFYLQGLDIKELWNIYCILDYSLFVNYKFQVSWNLDELYGLIFRKLKMCITDKYDGIENTDNNLVIIITDQFLNKSHAPTRRVLDYAYALAKGCGKRVMIINSSELNFYPCSCLQQVYMPNYMHDYDDVKCIQYKDLEIPFMQCHGYMPDIYCINETLRSIYAMQPGLVYNIGGSSMLSDLCNLFTKTACFPCSTNIPVSKSEYLLVGRSLNDNDKGRLERLETYQKVIETVVNYELPESALEYERGMFGIPEECFLIAIVGTRLAIELTEDFILLMNQIIVRWDVHFLVIGMFDDMDRTNCISKIENVHFAGGLREANRAIKICDIYCNPKRKGSGRSSFEALAHGIPVITLKYGDVYYTCGDDFAVDTYDDYLEQVGQYIADKQFLAIAKEKALQRARILCDLPGTQRKILEEIL